MVMNVLEEHLGCFFTGRWKRDTLCPGQKPGTHHSGYTAHNPEDYILNLNILHFPCIMVPSLPYL